MGSRTLDAVGRILSKLPRETQATDGTSLPSQEDVVGPVDTIRDLGETLRKFQTPDPVQVKTVLSQFADTKLRQSLSFSEMKEDLRMSMFPSMKSYIREIIQPLLPPTNRFLIYSVTVWVYWELETYLKQGFDADVDIGDIVTLTGEVTRAQALPCGEYMQQTWPRTGADTLTAVRYALKRGNSRKCPQTFLSSDPIHRMGIESPLLLY